MQCSEFARKMEQFHTFIRADGASLVTLVDLVSRLLLGSAFSCRCEKWSSRKHPEMALSFCPVAVVQCVCG